MSSLVNPQLSQQQFAFFKKKTFVSNYRLKLFFIFLLFMFYI